MQANWLKSINEQTASIPHCYPVSRAEFGVGVPNPRNDRHFKESHSEKIIVAEKFGTIIGFVLRIVFPQEVFMRYLILLCIAIVASLACVYGQEGGRSEDGFLILDESCYWRQYYRFGAYRISADALKTAEDKLARNKPFQRVKQNTLDWLEAANIDPEKVDWRDYAIFAPYYNPYTAPPIGRLDDV